MFYNNARPESRESFVTRILSFHLSGGQQSAAAAASVVVVVVSVIAVIEGSQPKTITDGRPRRQYLYLNLAFTALTKAGVYNITWRTPTYVRVRVSSLLYHSSH